MVESRPFHGCCRGFVLFNLGTDHGYKACKDQYEFNEALIKCWGSASLGNNVFVAITSSRQTKEKEFLKGLGFTSVKTGNLETHSNTGSSISSVLNEHVLERNRRKAEEAKKKAEIDARRKFLKVLPVKKSISEIKATSRAHKVYSGLVYQADINDIMYNCNSDKEAATRLESTYSILMSEREIRNHSLSEIRKLVYRKVSNARKLFRS